VLLALGLGAGLANNEMQRLVGTDIGIDEEGIQITVRGDRPRTIPVLRRWEAHVKNAATVAGDGAVFLPGRPRTSAKAITYFVDRLPPSEVGPLSVQRLRITWIVHHLRAQTPLRVLQTAAGSSAPQLVRYLAYLDDPDPLVTRRLLRDAAVE
jgi:hypothetical protein